MHVYMRFDLGFVMMIGMISFAAGFILAKLHR